MFLLFYISILLFVLIIEPHPYWSTGFSQSNYPQNVLFVSLVLILSISFVELLQGRKYTSISYEAMVEGTKAHKYICIYDELPFSFRPRNTVQVFRLQ